MRKASTVGRASCRVGESRLPTVGRSCRRSGDGKSVIEIGVTAHTQAKLEVLCLRDGVTRESFLEAAIEAYALMMPGWEPGAKFTSDQS